jgi:hypothetical protein
MRILFDKSGLTKALPMGLRVTSKDTPSPQRKNVAGGGWKTALF